MHSPSPTAKPWYDRVLHNAAGNGWVDAYQSDLAMAAAIATWSKP